MSNFEKFSKIISKNKYEIESLPAMYPDIILKFKSRVNLQDFEKKIKKISTLDNQKIFDSFFPDSGNLTLNIKFILHSEFSNKINQDLPKVFIFEDKLYDIDDFGISIFNRGYATSYHIPEGIVALTNYSNKTKNIMNSNFKKKQPIDIRKFTYLIMQLLEN